MNLQVISTNEDEKMTLTDAIFRETIGRFLCGVSMSIGYILIGLDSQKRGFHDMLADTRVVYAKKVKVYPVYQGGAQGVPVQSLTVPTTQEQPVSEEASESNEPMKFGYVPVQVEPAPNCGESPTQIAEGTYFYTSEKKLLEEETVIPQISEEYGENENIEE